MFKAYDILDNSVAISDSIVNIVHYVHNSISDSNMVIIHSIECSISLDCKTLYITKNTSQLLVHSVTYDCIIVHTFVYICIVCLQAMYCTMFTGF